MNETEKYLFNRMAFRLAKVVGGDYDKYGNKIAADILGDVLAGAGDVLDEDVRDKIERALFEASRSCRELGRGSASSGGAQRFAWRVSKKLSGIS